MMFILRWLLPLTDGGVWVFHWLQTPDELETEGLAILSDISHWQYRRHYNKLTGLMKQQVDKKNDIPNFIIRIKSDNTVIM
jgi:hypothetical protein